MPVPPDAPRKRSAAATRALQEAAARRARAVVPRDATKEIGGPSGLEPTRYGDWEKKGLTSDF
jgi:hypothetical protein